MLTKFATALRALGHECVSIRRPEMYFAPVSHSALGSPACHIIFRPPPLFRVLKGIPNVACVAWEFDRFPQLTDEENSSPVDDMAHMLQIPDEIWVPCDFTETVFRSLGIDNVHRIPAPIAAPQRQGAIRFPSIPTALERVNWVNLRIGFGRYSTLNTWKPSLPASLSDIIIEHYRGEQPLIFLAVFNPHDLRKNLPAMVGGFLQYNARHPNSLLLLKLVCDNDEDRLETILLGVLKLRIEGFDVIDTNSIWATTEYLDEEALGSLYRLADGYLCASLAEGQNLPLLEAMSNGAVPITTSHTAMGDYVSKSNAVIIESQPETIGRPDTAIGRTANVTWHRCTARDVADALSRFSEMTERERATISANARKTVRDRFSPAVVGRLIAARLDALGAGPPARKAKV